MRKLKKECFVVCRTCYVRIVISACPLFIISTWCFHEYIFSENIVALLLLLMLSFFFLLYFVSQATSTSSMHCAFECWIFIVHKFIYINRNEITFRKVYEKHLRTHRSTSSTGCHSLGKLGVLCSHRTIAYGTDGLVCMQFPVRVPWILTNIYCRFTNVERDDCFPFNVDICQIVGDFARFLHANFYHSFDNECHGEWESHWRKLKCSLFTKPLFEGDEGENVYPKKSRKKKTFNHSYTTLPSVFRFGFSCRFFFIVFR